MIILAYALLALGIFGFLILISSCILNDRATRCAWCREEMGLGPLPPGMSHTICQHHRRHVLAEAEALLLNRCADWPEGDSSLRTSDFVPRTSEKLPQPMAIAPDHLINRKSQI
jgi:hypothetical protein